MFSLLLFLAKNRDLYESNSEMHNINTRCSSDLRTPTANLTTFRKWPFYFGIYIFNYLPTNIKNKSHDIKQFRSTLQSYYYFKFKFLTHRYKYINTHIPICSDRYNFQLVFKFCIVIYYIILGRWHVQCYMCERMNK